MIALSIRILVRKIVRLMGFAWAIFFAYHAFFDGSAVYAAAYNPYSIEWVRSGFSAEQQLAPSYNDPDTIAGRDLSGTMHMIFYGIPFSSTSAKLYYTNNGHGVGIQGWLPLKQISEQSQPMSYGQYVTLQDHVALDAAGNPHMAWNDKPVSNGTVTNIQTFRDDVSDLWYRRRDAGGGGWLQETKVTDYRSEVVMYATDTYPCFGPGSEPRQWWARAQAIHPVLEVESGGTPRFAWTKTWLTLPFSPVSGARCLNTSNPPPVPPAYKTGVVAMYGVSGGEQPIPISAIYPSIFLTVANITIDYLGTAHLFVDVRSGSNFYAVYHASAPQGRPWGAATAQTPFEFEGTFVDAAVGVDNTIHALTNNYGPTKYYRIVNGVWQPGETLSIIYPGAEIVVNRDHQPFVMDIYRKVFTKIGGTWQRISDSSGEIAWNLFVTERDEFIVAAGNRMFMNVITATVLNGGGDAGNSIPIGSLGQMNVTNGDFGITLPLFSTQGLGPQSSVTLTYHTLGGGFSLPQERDQLSGWKLQAGKRVFHKSYSSPNAWVQTNTGETILFVQESGNANQFIVESRESLFMRLNRDPVTGRWQLRSAGGSIDAFLPSGNIDETRDANGNTLDFQYDDNPLYPGIQENLIRIVDAKNRTTTFLYDTNNLLTKITDPEGHEYALSYYPLGAVGGGAEQRLLQSVTRVRKDGAPNEVWRFTYHAANDQNAMCTVPRSLPCPAKRAYLQSIKDPLGSTTSFYYEIGGRLARVLDAAQSTLAVSYEDAAINHVPGIACTTFTPNDPNNTVLQDLRTRVTDWRGNITTFESDFETGTVWKIEDPLNGTPGGGTIEKTYASYNRLTCAKDKRGAVTTYDWLQSPPGDFVKYQLSDIRWPGILNPQHFTYTANHKIATITDPKRNVGTFAYADSINPYLITSKIEPADATGGTLPTTVMTYDSLGRLKTQQDPNGHVSTLYYDAPGDESGLVTSIQPSGTTGLQKFTYTRMGLLKTEKLPAAPDTIITSYDYDGANRLKMMTYPATPDHPASSVVQTYDQNGNLKTIRDELLKTTSYDYDVINRKTKVTRDDGTFSRFEYDASGNTTAVVDWNGTRDEFDYDKLNRLIEKRLAVSTPAHMTFCYDYDANGNIIKEKELKNGETCAAAARAATYSYDSLNRLTGSIDPNPFYAQTTTIERDSNSNVTKYIDRTGEQYVFNYTNRDLLKSVTRPGARVGEPSEANRIDMGYDLAGNRTADTFWRKDGGTWQPHVTTYAWNAANLLQSSTDPLNRTVSYRYDDNGNVTHVTDPAGMVTHYSYDARNRVKTLTRDFGPRRRLNLVTESSYDAGGNLKTARDANGKTTLYTYDALHRLLNVASPLGIIARYEYDANGNKTKDYDGNNQFYRYEYDALNRPTRVIDPLNQTVVLNSYDEFGDLRTKTDGNNTVKQFTYDELHRLKTVAYPTYTATFGYNANGKLKSVTDPNTNITNVYDSVNRLIRTADNILNRALEYDYDAMNARVAMRVMNGAATEETITYEYDAAGQIDTMTTPLGVFDFSFNTDGTPKKLTRPNGNNTDYSYDTAKRLRELTNRTPLGALISAFDSNIDAVGNRTSLDVTTDGLPSYSLSYSYDDFYRLTAEARTGTNPDAMSYGYDLAGNRLVMIGNGATTTYAYGAASQLLNEMVAVSITDDFSNPEMRSWIPLSGTWGVTGGEQLIGSSTQSLPGIILHSGFEPPAYSLQVDFLPPQSKFDKAGIILRYHNQNNFTRLELARKKYVALTSTVPRLHVNVVKRMNGVEELVAASAIVLPQTMSTLRAVVGGGSLATVAIGADAVLSNIPLDPLPGRIGLYAQNNAVYDNFLLNAAATTTYAYDGNGNMTARNAEAFTYDPDGHLLTFGNGSVAASYAYDAMGRRVRRTINGAAERYYFDGVSVLLDLDAAGAVTARASNGRGADERLAVRVRGTPYYFLKDPIGSTREITDSGGILKNRYDYDAFGNAMELAGSISNRYLFTGRELDSESGAYYYRARMYSPRSGRFGGRDPIRGIGSPYAYVGNNPANRTDPTGMDYTEIDGTNAKWVVEQDGAFNNSDVGEFSVGTVANGLVRLSQEFGGGTMSIDQFEDAADDFWVNFPDISGMDMKMQKGYIRSGLNRFRSIGPATFAERHPVMAGGLTGLKGGGQILTNELSFGLTDKIELTESESYSGEDYAGSRAGAFVAGVAMPVGAAAKVVKAGFLTLRSSLLGVRGTQALIFAGNLGKGSGKLARISKFGESILHTPLGKSLAAVLQDKRVTRLLGTFGITKNRIWDIVSTQYVENAVREGKRIIALVGPDDAWLTARGKLGSALWRKELPAIFKEGGEIFDYIFLP